MVRIFAFLLPMLACADMLCAATAPPDVDTAALRREADAFLASMPAGLQSRQRDAVCRAIGGDTAALDSVRLSRNAPSPLPEGVTAAYVTPRLRLYRPSADSGAARPLLVYLHGGGWTFGSINSCSRFCGELVARAGVAVLAVDYALAPAAPYPKGLDDCVAAVRFAMEHAREWGSADSLVSVGGDSSGGNLAVAAALRMISSGEKPPRSLVLFYPVTKAYADGSESWLRYGAGFGLDSDLMEAFNRAYAPHDARNPMVSVAHAPDSLLSRLPATLIVAAGRDILCDQGRAFADRLARLGVEVRRHELAQAVHLFITVPGQPLALERALDLAGSFVGR